MFFTLYMDNFTVCNPTTLHFGRNVITSLAPALLNYGKKVLLVYGTGSIKRSGLYDRIKELLIKNGMVVYEYGGIKPNPRVRDVDAAADLGRINNIDVILAVGGGSVIDSGKIISITIPVSHSAWDFYTYKEKPVTSVPLVAVLTLAATGTEMNAFAVLQNPDTQIKSGYHSVLIYPKHSFLDPELTCSVPKDYTAYGIADLIAHCFENYFSIGESTLTDRFIISIVREAMEYGPLLLNDLHNYELRAKIMFAATMALNGLTAQGKTSGDWGVHAIGHVLSLVYDIPHGASLTIVYPAWMKFFKERLSGRISELGSELFQSPGTADESISKIEMFFKSIGCPTRLSDLRIPGDPRQSIYDAMVTNKVNGAVMKFGERDYRKMVELMI